LTLKRNYDRLISNRKIEIESQKFDIQNTKLKIIQTESLLKRTRNNLELIRSNLDNLFIKVPISGRISYINVEVGESISPGQKI
jgi:HlyD family secretion protein